MSTVLVAKGNADIRDAMARIFARAGHHVVAVVDAWDEVCRSVPDLVVLDVSLPRVSGLDVCRARCGPVRRRPASRS